MSARMADIERAFGAFMLRVVPELEQTGIIVSIGEKCCWSCGHRELSEQLEEGVDWDGNMSTRGLTTLVRSIEADEEEPFWRGYVFINAQSMESFRENPGDGALWLAAGDEATADEVAEVAFSHGLSGSTCGEVGIRLDLGKGVNDAVRAEASR